MYRKPRIYISSPVDKHLSSQQNILKETILEKIVKLGYEPQEFGVSGLPKRLSWSFGQAQEIIKMCHGAIILAFSQWNSPIGNGDYIVMPSEYNHFEGALALNNEIPTFIIKDEEVAPRGIAYYGGGSFIVDIPNRSTRKWFNTKDFGNHFYEWSNSILAKRYDVFLGYCSGATNTANAIVGYLNNLGVKVKNWQTGFVPGGSILDEIEDSAKSCLGGIFLFTKDDDIVSGSQAHASPRDNVLFEAGYFMHSKGKKRTLIIRESGAKMPADIGGNIYLNLNDRNDVSTIESGIRHFVESQL